MMLVGNRMAMWQVYDSWWIMCIVLLESIFFRHYDWILDERMFLHRNALGTVLQSVQS